MKCRNKAVNMGNSGIFDASAKKYRYDYLYIN